MVQYRKKQKGDINMYKTSKKSTYVIIAIVTMITTLFTSFSTFYVKADVNDSIGIINKYVDSIAKKDWGTFTSLMPNDEQADYQNYFADNSITNGVKQIEEVTCKSITKVDNNNVKDDLLSNEFTILQHSNNIESYIVGLDCKVSTENEFFYNGLITFL